HVHPLVPKQFDVVISRFGTMLFADPVAAFSNIARAARPEERLVMLVSQSHDRNEWAIAIDAALSPGRLTPGHTHCVNPSGWRSLLKSSRCWQRRDSATSGSKTSTSQSSTDLTASRPTRS